MIVFALYAAALKRIGAPRIKGAVRVLAYTSVVSIAVGAVTAHKAEAALGEQSLAIGENFANLMGNMQDAHLFNINGQTVHTSSSHSLEGKKALLDKFEAACKAEEGGDAPVWNEIPDHPEQSALPTSTLSSLIPIVRHDQGDKGTVVCITPTKTASERTLHDSWKAFQASGNLNEIGRLRYVFVTEGTAGSTVLMIWTEGDFNMKALMPQPGHDSPGEDPKVLMRPQGSNRIVNATVAGLPYQVYGYQSSDSTDKVMADYDKQMFAAGWMSVANPMMVDAPNAGGIGHAYMKNGAIGYVTASPGPDGHTLIGMAEVAGPLPDGFKLKDHTVRNADGF